MITLDYVLDRSLVIFRQFSQSIGLEYLVQQHSSVSILKEGCDVLAQVLEAVALIELLVGAISGRIYQKNIIFENALLLSLNFHRSVLWS